MKQSDIFTVLIVATIGTIAAAILCNMLLGDPGDKQVTFNTVSVVSADLALPDDEVFNPDAVNPTVEIYVGDCIDQDKDGKLSDEELRACGRGDSVTNLDDKTEESQDASDGD